ncbi:MAG: hypothetical protein HY736_04015 [Verrucomicrobia bacterium]|nr:hypothetical protein [Verrucomicrobiota bacterium]
MNLGDAHGKKRVVLVLKNKPGLPPATLLLITGASTMKNGFKPIRLEDYVELHVRANRGVERADLVRRLRHAIDAPGEACAADAASPFGSSVRPKQACPVSRVSPAQPGRMTTSRSSLIDVSAAMVQL